MKVYKKVKTFVELSNTASLRYADGNPDDVGFYNINTTKHILMQRWKLIQVKQLQLTQRHDT